jgi:hypothetical protein
VAAAPRMTPGGSTSSGNPKPQKNCLLALDEMALA